MIALLRIAAIANRGIDLAARRIAVAAARAGASAATTVLSAGGALDESRASPPRGGLTPAEMEVLDAAVAVPDDDQIRCAENPVAAVPDAFRATIRLIEAAAALRAERRAAATRKRT